MNTKYIIGAVAVIAVLWIGFTWGNKDAVAPGVIVSDTEGQSSGDVVSAVVGAPVVSKPVTTAVSPKPVASTPSLPAMTKDGAYIVSYTNSGFSPKSLTIKTGKSVHFVNNSAKAMSIVTTTTQNQVQSELNQGKTVGQGGTYDFTFLAPGTWVYMNRNAQSDFATIIVE